MKKIQRTAKIGGGRRPSPNWLLDPIISKLDKHVVLSLINYIACKVLQLCKENYSNCLWRKTDWALDLPKLGKASKISSDLRRSPEIVTSLRKSWEVFWWSLEIFGSVRAIFGNLWSCSGDIRKSSEVLVWSSGVFGIVRVIFGNLRKFSGDLWKSSGMFGWSSEIFGRFRVAFDNLRKVNSLISLRQTVLFFPQIGHFLHFYSKSLLKTVQSKS